MGRITAAEAFKHAEKTPSHCETALDNEIVVTQVILAKPIPQLLASVTHGRCSCKRGRAVIVLVRDSAATL